MSNVIMLKLKVNNLLIINPHCSLLPFKGLMKFKPESCRFLFKIVCIALKHPKTQVCYWPKQ